MSFIATTETFITCRHKMRETTILIVEDEPTTAKLVEVILTNSGYSVAGIVSSGEAAVKIARKSEPEIILMDIKLGNGIDGITAYEQIKESTDVPVIFISAYTDKVMVDRAMECDPAGYIVKPFKVEELLHKIGWVLDQKRAVNMKPQMKAHLFPDAKLCRTRHLSSDYWQCLTKEAEFCPYRFRLVDRHLCKHPENYECSEDHKGE